MPLLRNFEKSKLWAIINSAFFLWFSTTVIVGLGTYLFKKWDSQRSIYIENQDKIQKLDTEISSRLEYFREQIKAGESKQKAILILENPIKSEFPPGVFPELNNRPLRALIYELKTIVPGSERAEIEKALVASNEFKKIYLATERYPNIFDDVLGNANRKAFSKNQNTKKPEKEINKEVRQDKKNDQKDNLSKQKDDKNLPVGTIPTPKANIRETSDGKIVEIAPIHITIDVRISYDEATRIIKFTFDSFNLKRWGYPFKDYKTKTSLNMKQIE